MEFYKKVEVDEHLLYAKEIAQIYGIYVYSSDKPANLFVSKLLNKIIADLNLEQEQLYYLTYTGTMAKVYPKKIYQRAMNMFFKDIYMKYKNINSETKIKYKIGEKNYYIKIK